MSGRSSFSGRRSSAGRSESNSAGRSGGKRAGRSGQQRAGEKRRSNERQHQNTQTQSGRGLAGRGLAGRDDVVMGRNCLTEIVRKNPERLIEAWIARGEGRPGNQRQHDLEKALESLSIQLHFISREDLTALVGSESHQGVVARIYPRKSWELDALIEVAAQKPTSIILALDNIVDPQNLGAILRAAECFGVDGVLWSKNRGAPISAVVAKVSVGGAELVRLAPVSNLQRGLEQLKRSGYWVVGAALGEGSETIDTFKFPERTVVVLGAEGDGLSHIIEENLDFKLNIPMHGQIDSLNVSQATAVFLAAAARSHRLGGC